jgi:ectoine hydroxylase-related dioxygenase (phytanoyl-CoA dioxygenase family)
MKKYTYNTNEYSFIDIVQQVFNIKSLDQIHTILEQQLEIPTDPSEDQKTIFHKKFYSLYENEDSEFLSIYKRFVRHIASNYFKNGNIIYQTKPTFRVQTPNNIAVAKWHKDKAYNHSANEINIFLPLTKAFDTNTIWVESEEDKADYSPMNAEIGEFYIWNGANLMHGNKENTTGVSRVSVDFRIIFEDNFAYSGTSVTTKVPMKLGHYWSKL